MKKILILLVALSVLTMGVYGEEMKILEDKLGDYALKINGDMNFVLKNQESYKSPFDTPEWAWDQRAGASNRDSQFMRMQGSVHLYSGDPGVSEWFTLTTLWFDINSPDNIDSDMENRNIEEKKIEIRNAFLMWRPFLIEEKGRPFGITVGVQSIKATANAAYSNNFSGDLDNDYVAYTISVLQNKPMVNFDFHIANNTGLGYALVKGSSDIIQNSTAFSDDYSRTHVFYGEYEKNRLRLNGAWQIAQGNREETKEVATDYSMYKELDYKYTSNVMNVQASYELELGDGVSLMPFVGYQKLWGDEASFGKFQAVDAYSTKEAGAEVLSMGMSLKAKAFGKNIKISGEYSDVSTADFNGLDGMEDGQLDEAVSVAGADLGLTYDLSTAAFAGIAGGGESTYSLVGLDGMYHFEATMDVNSNVTVTLFYEGQLAQKVKNIEISDKQKAEIAEVLNNDLGVPTNEQATNSGYTPGVDVMTAEIVAEGIAAQLDGMNRSGTEWTDSSSFGIAVKYKF